MSYITKINKILKEFGKKDYILNEHDVKKLKKYIGLFEKRASDIKILKGNEVYSFKPLQKLCIDLEEAFKEKDNLKKFDCFEAVYRIIRNIYTMAISMNKNSVKTIQQFGDLITIHDNIKHSLRNLEKQIRIRDLEPLFK
jgi:protein-arginine kinase activator protein McsA